jgi:hypothetical protein
MTLRLRAAALAGTATVLAAGALVGVATTAAQAADPAGVGYNCHNAAFNADVPVLVGATGFPSELTAGESVPAGDVPVTFTLTREVIDGMNAKGINQVGVSSKDLALAVGSTSVGLTGVNVAKAATPATGDMVMAAPSKNAEFAAPVAGTYDLKLPSTFTGTVDTNLAPLAVTCTILDASTATIGSTTVTGDGEPGPVMQDSTTSVKAPAKVKQGKAVNLAVSVSAEVPATGDVTAVEKGKELGSATLVDGSAKITVKGLKPGTHKITVSYGGDEATNASSSKAVKVKVVKKKHKK